MLVEGASQRGGCSFERGVVMASVVLVGCTAPTTFHFLNHVSADCREKYSPQAMQDNYPSYNTQAGEQTFLWVGRFRHILRSMNKTHHLFKTHYFLHII